MLEFIAKYWIEFLFGALIYMLGALYKKFTKYQKEQVALQDGMKALLHDRIIQKCKYHLSIGKISDDDLDEIYYMNKPYKELGGNGTVKIVIKKVEVLKIKQEEN